MGITTFTIFFSDMAPPATLELFAKEVMPAFADGAAIEAPKLRQAQRLADDDFHLK